MSAAPHPARLDAARSALVVVDLQESFRTHVEGFAALVRATGLLVRVAAMLDVPIVVTEQYPNGLGSTVSELAGLLDPDVPRLDKCAFSAVQAPAWRELPTSLQGRVQWVVAGIEAHVCVRHTTLDLLARGREVHLPVDAVGSRTATHADVALDSLVQAGARRATVEQVAFDWLGAAGTPSFRAVQQLVREHIELEQAEAARMSAGR